VSWEWWEVDGLMVVQFEGEAAWWEGAYAGVDVVCRLSLVLALGRT